MQAFVTQVFPPARADASALSACLLAKGVAIRAAATSDLPFMRRLYGELRSDEVAQAPWPASVKEVFLDSQFALQHQHFVTYYAAADFMMVELEGSTIGRYYLLRTQPNFLIVDIALRPGWRGRGIGGALIEWTKALVENQQADGIDLHVDERNTAAHRLYTRLGFRETTQERPYIGMHWSHAR